MSNNSEFEREVMGLSVKVSTVLAEVDWETAMTVLARVAATMLNSRNLEPHDVAFSTKCFIEDFTELVRPGPLDS